jgi:hypothetical protein
MVKKDEIYTIIRNDIPLRDKLRALFGITDASVWRLAARKAPKLMEYPAIKIIMEHTGKEEHEIFDMEPSK